MSLFYEPCCWKTQSLSAEFKPVYKEQLPLVRSNVDQVVYKSKQRTPLAASPIILISFLLDKKLYNKELFQLTLKYTENIAQQPASTRKMLAFSSMFPALPKKWGRG